MQLKRIALGFTMVASFSLGLALTMVTTGVLAAWSVQHAQKRFKGFGEAMRRAPYVSCALLVAIAAYMAWLEDFARTLSRLHRASSVFNF